MNNKNHKFTSAIIAAAGSGSRMKSDISKQFIMLGDTPVLAKTLLAFESATEIDEIIVVTKEADIPAVTKLKEKYEISKVTRILNGGATRQESVCNGISSAIGELILIHDGARPFITPDEINSVADALYTYEAAALGIPVTDTLKSADSDAVITGTVDRSNLYSIQTPQGFRAEVIKKAHAVATQNNLSATDDCALCENLGIGIKIIEGSPTNIKITRPDDLKMSAAILGGREDEKAMRSGLGYDVHRLVENRDLILGGVKIPHELGLLGHSDADVLLHAIMDALLGAAALGDIGRHFPDTDDKWLGADSGELLRMVGKLLLDKGAKIINIDATIIAQRPKISPYIPQMIDNISSILKIDKSCVNVKATTTERLGFCGREEGIAAEAICCVEM